MNCIDCGKEHKRQNAERCLDCAHARNKSETRRRARMAREKKGALTVEDIASTPTLVITDEGQGKPITDVPAHLARLQ